MPCLPRIFKITITYFQFWMGRTFCNILLFYSVNDRQQITSVTHCSFSQWAGETRRRFQVCLSHILVVCPKFTGFLFSVTFFGQIASVPNLHCKWRLYFGTRDEAGILSRNAQNGKLENLIDVKFNFGSFFLLNITLHAKSTQIEF